MKFMKLGNTWINPKRIEYVKDVTVKGAKKGGSCEVHFFSGEKMTFTGEDGKRLMEYLGTKDDASEDAG